MNNDQSEDARGSVSSTRTEFLDSGSLSESDVPDGRWFPLPRFQPGHAPSLAPSYDPLLQLNAWARSCVNWWYNERFPLNGTSGASATIPLRARWLGDLMAGIVVATLLIPSGMAYAMLAGLPPHVGLYASVAPLLVYAALGSSSCLSIGPVTVVSLLVGGALAPLAPLGSSAYLANAVALATLSGAILIAMGTLRLGFLANLLSHPVLLGFTSGVGIVIVVNQLKTILGVSAASSDFLPLQLWNILGASSRLNVASLMIGSIAMAALWFRDQLAEIAVRIQLVSKATSQHLARGIPLILVIAGAGVAWLFGLATNAGIAVVGTLPAGLMPLTWPVPTDVNWLALIPSALLLSLIGFVEGISIAKRLEPVGTSALKIDRELIAVGAANFAAACTGGYPVSGGTARTALNHSAGAVTPLANAWSAIVVLLCVLALAPLIYHLPTAVLAAIIITACASLINFEPYFALRQTSPADALAFATTCAATISCGAKWGLGVGVMVSIMVLAYRATQVTVTRLPTASASPQTCPLQITGWLNFANAASVERQIELHVTQSLGISPVGTTRCIVRLDPVHASDATGHHMLNSLKHRLTNRGVELIISHPV
jgi:sulfate permease, SulP family